MIAILDCPEQIVMRKEEDFSHLWSGRWSGWGSAVPDLEARRRWRCICVLAGGQRWWRRWLSEEDLEMQTKVSWCAFIWIYLDTSCSPGASVFAELVSTMYLHFLLLIRVGSDDFAIVNTKVLDYGLITYIIIALQENIFGMLNNNQTAKKWKKLHKYPLFSSMYLKPYCRFSIYTWSNQITLTKTALARTTGVVFV